MIIQVQYLPDFNVHFIDGGGGRHVLALDDVGDIALSYIDPDTGAVAAVSGLANFTLVRR